MRQSADFGANIVTLHSATDTRAKDAGRRGVTCAERYLEAGAMRRAQEEMRDAEPGAIVVRVQESLTVRAGCSLTYRTKADFRTWTDGPEYWNQLGWQATALEGFDQGRACRIIAASLVGTPKDWGLTYLSRAALMTRGTADGSDWEAQARLYLVELERHPPDIVAAAIDTHIQRSKWFPAWSELAAILNPLTGYRVGMMQAVERLE
jgi:hypothetical protein